MRIAYINRGDTFDGLCECGFSTRGWPSEEFASLRISEHAEEHEGGPELSSLSEFREANGLSVALGGKVFPEGAQEIERTS